MSPELKHVANQLFKLFKLFRMYSDTGLSGRFEKQFEEILKPITKDWIDIELLLPEVKKDVQDGEDPSINVLTTNGKWIAISTVVDKWSWYQHEKARGVIAWCEIPSIEKFKNKG